MPTGEIITIGTEILLGEILDTNARYLARQLRQVGIDLYRTTTIGDNSQRIARAIQHSLDHCDIILTTGGLGPTIDDPTREAVASALGVTTEFLPELWEQIQARFQRFGRQPTENNRRQAYIPEGAIPIENPVGTAPAFIARAGKKVVISLPGVPREMEYLMEHTILPYLKQNFQLSGIIKARLIHTVGVGESLIDDRISDLETLSNPSVGLAAHSGQVDVRITAKANSEARADEMIQQIEMELRNRLGDWIYGVDQDTLEKVTLRALKTRGWSLAVIELGASFGLINRLSSLSVMANSQNRETFKGGEIRTDLTSHDAMIAVTNQYRENRQVNVCLGITIFPLGEKQELHMFLVTPEDQKEIVQTYGGPPEYASRWANHQALDLLRKLAVTDLSG
jgi:competence/damage-inducible protein CinA-like protein